MLTSSVALKNNRELLDGRWDKHDTKDAANVADLTSQGKFLFYDYPVQKVRDLRTPPHLPPEGYFIGDEESIRKACKWFEKDGERQPGRFQSIMKNNPNPRKVAEALAGGRVREEQPPSRPAEGRRIGRSTPPPLLPGE